MAVPAADPAALFEARLRELRASRRARSVLLAIVGLASVLASARVAEFDPVRLAAGLPRIGEYVWLTLPQLRLAQIGTDLAEWFYDLGHWLRLLAETLGMAYLGTLLGTLGALAGCFAAARNLTPDRRLMVLLRRLYEVCRSVPELVFALLFIFAFGLGPMAGVLAIAIHSMGGSGKLFAEAAENADMRAVDALRAAGAGWWLTCRYAVLPQVLPNFVSFTLWRFEINVRSSAIIGFVGAGGIGEELFTAVRVLYYEDISAIILLLIATVGLIDEGCERLRRRLAEGPVSAAAMVR